MFKYKKETPEEKRKKMESLKKITMLAIFSILYSFILKLVGTFSYKSFYNNLFLVKSTTILSLVATIIMILFFIAFCNSYINIKRGGEKIRIIGIFVIIGYLSIVDLQLQVICNVFNISLPHIFKPTALDSFALFLQSIFLLIFFIIFYRNTKPELKNSIGGAIIGISILVLERFCVLFKLFEHLPKIIIGVFPFLMIVYFITLINFFINFYREIIPFEKEYKIKE